MALLKWAYKRSREYARRMQFYRGEFLPQHPQFSAESEALCRDDAEPAPVDAPDIRYSKDDDMAVEQWTRKTGKHVPYIRIDSDIIALAL